MPCDWNDHTAKSRLSGCTASFSLSNFTPGAKAWGTFPPNGGPALLDPQAGQGIFDGGGAMTFTWYAISGTYCFFDAIPPTGRRACLSVTAPTATPTPTPMQFSSRVRITSPVAYEQVNTQHLLVRWVGPAPQQGFQYAINVTYQPNGWKGGHDCQFQVGRADSGTFSYTFHFRSFGAVLPGDYDIRLWRESPQNTCDPNCFIYVPFTWRPSP